MPRPDVTALLADSWHSLPHEDGRPRRLMHFSQFGHDDETRKKIQALGLDLGECVQHLLETHGYTISHKDDPRPADAEGYKTTRIKCLKCGKQLLQIGVDHDLVAQFSPLALRSAIAALSTKCPNHE